MTPRAQYFLFLVIDIEKFGGRPDHVQAWLRSCLYELLERAFHEAGIDPRAAPPPEDRGDGMLWLLPGTVPRTQLLGAFVERLRVRLRAHGQTSNELGALRLRVALHSGDAAWDGRGWVGTDLNTAFRLVDLDPLREALAARPEAELALVVEDSWHRSVIRGSNPELDTAGFRPVTLDIKELAGGTAWIQVPGYPDGGPPPDVRRTRDTAATPHVGSAGGGTGGPDAARRSEAPAARTTLRAESGSQVGQQIGTHYGPVTHHHLPEGGSVDSPVYHLYGDGSSGSGDVYHVSGQNNTVHGDVTNGHAGPHSAPAPDDAPGAAADRVERARRRARRRDQQS